MRKVLTMASACVLALSACSYPTEEACLEQHAQCHVGAFDGNWHAGAGIDINSPAGQAILGGVMSNMMQPTYQQPVTLWVRPCTIYNQIARQC